MSIPRPSYTSHISTYPDPPHTLQASKTLPLQSQSPSGMSAQPHSYIEPGPSHTPHSSKSSRPLSPKLKILWWFCSISRPPTALLCFVFYTWSSVTLHAPGLMNCLVSLFIIIKAQAWKTHYLILSNLAIFFLTFLMPCFFASLFISDGFL